MKQNKILKKYIKRHNDRVADFGLKIMELHYEYEDIPIGDKISILESLKIFLILGNKEAFETIHALQKEQEV